MKKILLILPLLTLLSVAQAEDEMSAQVISYGVSPAGICETFPDAAIPAAYKRVENCSVVQDDNRNTSLRERLMMRFQNRAIRNTNAENDDRVSGKYKRLGRGAFTKRAVSGDRTETTTESNGIDRRATRKNFRSAYRTHNLKGGFDRGTKSTGHTNARQRPSFKSRVNTKNTDRKISTAAKWTASANQRFSERSYGANPYSLASKRNAQQRAVRAQRKANARVDVNGRITSNQFKWRPGRLDGNLDGDSSFRETQAEIQAEVQAELAE